MIPAYFSSRFWIQPHCEYKKGNVLYRTIIEWRELENSWPTRYHWSFEQTSESDSLYSKGQLVDSSVHCVDGQTVEFRFQKIILTLL